MTVKKPASAKRLYEKHLEEMDRESKYFWSNCASFLLRLPIPMSYEVWSELHKIIEGDKGDVE